MKCSSFFAEFPHSWNELATALLQRYPNPFSKHVLTEDVLDRYVKDDGTLYSLKLLTKTNPLPRWAIPLYRGPKFVAIIEESIIDPDTQTFTTYSRNVTLYHFLSCTEKCVYKSNDSNNSTSLIDKRIWLDSSMGYGLKLPILEFSMSRYKGNQLKASQGLEYVLTNRLPPTLRDVLRQKTERLTESAKHSTELISQKAKMASDMARMKAGQAKTKAKSKAELAKSTAASMKASE